MNDALNGEGKAQQVLERSEEIRRQGYHGPGAVLPGFHIFSAGGPRAVHEWAVPRPKGDLQDLVGLWEAFVHQTEAGAQPGSDVLTPIRQDSLALPVSARIHFFGRGRRSFRDWFLPAVQIIAIAQHLEGQATLTFRTTHADRIERRTIEEVGMHLGPYFLHAERRGMWSNTDGRLRRPLVGPPTSRSLETLCVRPHGSRHPLAIALMEDEEVPETARQAANVVLRMVHYGEMPDRNLVRLQAGRRAPRSGTNLYAAALSAIDRPGALRNLSEILVPQRLNAATFRELFGNPYREVGPPRPATKERWISELYGLFPLEAGAVHAV